MVTKLINSFMSNYMSWILSVMLAINVMLWLQDGITWLLLPSNQSLAFLLVDNGFDVWVANTRGTKFSRQHTSLPSNSSVSLCTTCCFTSVVSNLIGPIAYASFFL